MISAWFENARRRHREYLREIDKNILWSSIRASAPNESKARDAFLLHCLNDPNWAEVPLDSIVAQVAELPYGP